MCLALRQRAVVSGQATHGIDRGRFGPMLGGDNAGCDQALTLGLQVGCQRVVGTSQLGFTLAVFGDLCAPAGQPVDCFGLRPQGRRLYQPGQLLVDGRDALIDVGFGGLGAMNSRTGGIERLARLGGHDRRIGQPGQRVAEFAIATHGRCHTTDTLDLAILAL